LLGNDFDYMLWKICSACSIRMQPKQAFPEYIKIRLILIMFEKRYHAKLFKMELYLRNVSCTEIFKNLSTSAERQIIVDIQITSPYI